MLKNSIASNSSKKELALINNSVYTKKHYYAFLLRDLKAIKMQTEKKAKEDPGKLKELGEIYEIYQRIVVGMLREGIDFQFVEDKSHPENSLIRLKIDSVEYEILNTSVKSILKNDYEDIMGFEYDGPSVEREDTIADKQLEAQVKESVKNKTKGKGGFNSSVPIAFKYEEVKKKRRNRQFVMDLLEIVLAIFVIKVCLHNAAFEHYATAVYNIVSPILNKFNILF